MLILFFIGLCNCFFFFAFFFLNKNKTSWQYVCGGNKKTRSGWSNFETGMISWERRFCTHSMSQNLVTMEEMDPISITAVKKIVSFISYLPLLLNKFVLIEKDRTWKWNQKGFQKNKSQYFFNMKSYKKHKRNICICSVVSLRTKPFSITLTRKGQWLSQHDTHSLSSSSAYTHMYTNGFGKKNSKRTL